MKHDWEYKKLGEVCDFERGLTYSKDDESSLPTVNIVFRSNNVDLETKRIVLDDLKYLVSDYHIPESKMVKPQTILMCMSNGSMQHVGKVAYIDKKYDAAFGGFMGLIIPKSNCYPKYLFYFLNSPTYRHFLLSIANGINITNLKFSDLRNLNLPVPALAVQERIVGELDKVSEIIEKKKEQLKELDNLAQSIFYDMFGDPVENEKGWPKQMIGELCEDKKSIIRASKTFCQTDTIRYIDISSIDNKANVVVSMTPFVYKDAPSRAQQVVKHSDILVSLVRPNLKNIAIVNDLGEDLVASSGFCVLRTKMCAQFFLKSVLLSDRFTKYLTDRVSGANYPAIREEDIKCCLISNPPLSLQQAFAEKVEAIEKQKELINQSIKEAQLLFDSRMEYWFGE